MTEVASRSQTIQTEENIFIREIGTKLHFVFEKRNLKKDLKQRQRLKVRNMSFKRIILYLI
jgi:hypothetical protein